MIAPELKPCPFCGGEATLEKGPSAYSVACAKGSSCIGSGLLIGFMHDDLDNALAQWNTRAAPSSETGLSFRSDQIGPRITPVTERDSP